MRNIGQCRHRLTNNRKHSSVGTCWACMRDVKFRRRSMLVSVVFAVEFASRTILQAHSLGTTQEEHHSFCLRRQTFWSLLLGLSTDLFTEARGAALCSRPFSAFRRMLRCSKVMLLPRITWALTVQLLPYWNLKRQQLLQLSCKKTGIHEETTKIIGSRRGHASSQTSINELLGRIGDRICTA